MGIQKIRDMHRRQRRRRKARNLKMRLLETTSPAERAKLIEKLRRISLYPDREVPRE